MSNMNSQLISNMQSDDRAYGDNSIKVIVQKDKSKKNQQQFSRMSVQDIMNMQEDGDYEYEEGYETV